MSDSIRILFLDDQPDFLETMSFWMQSKGYTVTATGDCAAAIEKIRAKGVDIVFVDFKMPEMNGIEVLRKKIGRAHV